MLLEQFKNKKDEEEIKNNWIIFSFKNGHKKINADNFLKYNYSYCRYKVEKRYYKGYFKQNEIKFIFKVLDYHKGTILTLMG